MKKKSLTDPSGSRTLNSFAQRGPEAFYLSNG